jgi:hypothetical protein
MTMAVRADAAAKAMQDLEIVREANERDMEILCMHQ